MDKRDFSLQDLALNTNSYVVEVSVTDGFDIWTRREVVSRKYPVEESLPFFSGRASWEIAQAIDPVGSLIRGVEGGGYSDIYNQSK